MKKPTMKSVKMMFSCLFTLPLVLTIIRRNPFPAHSGAGDQVADSEGFQTPNTEVVDPIGPVSGDYSYSSPAREDKLLGGLLATGFDEGSCLSRYQSAFYRKPSIRMPSSHLLSKLQSYEGLHARCGPHTRSYNKTVELLEAGQSLGPTDCNYLVLVSFGGFGNRLLSLVSAFLYALLTNRVLLVDRGKDMSDLLCEPFPNMSWLLPLDFPVADKLNGLDQSSSRCYGHMVKNNVINYSNGSLPTFIYLHLVHDYDDHDKLFFCAQDQSLLQKASWLIMKTDNYFVPSLFLIPSFEQELNRLFPEKELVFHHLGRYLFHPTNEVWELITRYHQTYLAKADERIGIQIETSESGTQPFSHVVMDQILACTSSEKILPQVNMEQSESVIIRPKNQKSVAVLVTSSNSGYYENLTSIYREHPTINGEILSIHQASHKDFQQAEMMTQNKKAWAEMFLLSLTDVLLTSSSSTFGYVAHGLRGWTPWILLLESKTQTFPDLPCRPALSIEPCFQAPPLVDCNSKNNLYSQSVVDHVRRCEDMMEGIKLVDGLSDDIS